MTDLIIVTVTSLSILCLVSLYTFHTYLEQHVPIMVSTNTAVS